MRFLVLFLTMTLGMSATAASNAKEYAASFAWNHGQGFSIHELGRKVIEDQTRDIKLTYDFSKQGGAISTINMLRAATPGSSGAPSGTLPKNAIVMGCYIDVLTTPTGAGASIAIGTGQATNDIKTATAVASYSGIVACSPTGSAATSIKLTADRIPTVTISGGVVTAGKINVHIQYLLSD